MKTTPYNPIPWELDTHVSKPAGTWDMLPDDDTPDHGPHCQSVSSFSALGWRCTFRRGHIENGGPDFHRAGNGVKVVAEWPEPAGRSVEDLVRSMPARPGAGPRPDDDAHRGTCSTCGGEINRHVTVRVTTKVDGVTRVISHVTCDPPSRAAP